MMKLKRGLTKKRIEKNQDNLGHFKNHEV
jgi:hypothetical protein